MGGRDPAASATERLDVACGRMNDDQPGASDSFTVRPKAATGDPKRLLAGAAFGTAAFRLKQFALWTITSNPAKGGYVGIGSFGFGSGPSAAEFREVRSIFKDAGVDPAKYRALK